MAINAETLYLSYDDGKKEGCNLKGIYNPSIHKIIPSPNIVISHKEREEIHLNKRSFRVDNGKLVKFHPGNAPDKQLAQRKKDNRLLSVKFEGKTYRVTERLMGVLGLNLSICSHKPDHKTQVWAIMDEKWVPVTHDKKSLLELSIAVDSQRQQLSDEVYGGQQ